MDFNGVLQSLGDMVQYIRANPADFANQLRTDLELSGLALAIGIGLCFPLGILASRRRWISVSLLNAFGAARAVPSVAILFLAYPVIGLGFRAALLALAVVACPPILILSNLDTTVLLVGAVPVALLTLTAEIVLGGLEMWSRQAAGVPTG